MFRNMASSNFPHSLNPSQVPAARHGNLITNNLVVSDEAVPFAACWKAERCRSIGHPLKSREAGWPADRPPLAMKGQPPPVQRSSGGKARRRDECKVGGRHICPTPGSKLVFIAEGRVRPASLKQPSTNRPAFVATRSCVNNGRIRCLISRSDAAHNASVSSIDAVCAAHDIRIMVAHGFRSPQGKQL
jgi:hypothetical protein